MPSITNSRAPEPVSSGRAVSSGDSRCKHRPDVPGPDFIDQWLFEARTVFFEAEFISDNAAAEYDPPEFEVSVVQQYARNDERAEAMRNNRAFRTLSQADRVSDLPCDIICDPATKELPRAQETQKVKVAIVCWLDLEALIFQSPPDRALPKCGCSNAMDEDDGMRLRDSIQIIGDRGPLQRGIFVTSDALQKFSDLVSTPGTFRQKAVAWAKPSLQL